MRYIGCKALLLDNIKEVLDKHVVDARSFCDIFSGTATVARYFKRWYEIYSNDLLYFSYCLQRSTVENDELPKFETLKNHLNGVHPIDYFNFMNTQDMESLPVEKRFFQNNYSPKGGRMYLTDSNALRIDFARNKVQEWYEDGILSEDEYYYLIACIVEGIPFVSNISGTYGAFNRFWDARSNKIFSLFELSVYTNGLNNRSYNQDSNELIDSIHGDILYIDPPYNERQYLPNYHVLETAAKYDFPELTGITGQRHAGNQKSEFCSKRTVLKAFEHLIANACFRHIVLSYNTDGIMTLSDIEEIMKSYCKADTFEINYIPYRRFKSRNSTKTEELKELLIYIEKEV